MKKGLYYLIVFFPLFILSSCLNDKTEEGEILCRINGYNLPVDDFRRQLAEDLELNRDFKLTQKAKQQFLEELIRKELLIQEAKKLNLDRKDKFIRAIERYWESTLIRDLMELKGEEISKRTYVLEEEIKARYQKMKKLDDTLSPLSEMQGQITEELREEKKTRMLEEWINDLRTKASVEIDQDLL